MLDRPEPTIAPLLPPARSRILRPGIRTLAIGVERHTIEGGRSIVVDLGEGDRIAVTDVEGGQPCELIAFGADGRAEPGLIGAAGKEAAGEPSSATRAALGAIADRLKRRNIIALSGVRSVRIFGDASPAGDTQEFRAEQTGYLVVSAPAEAMDPGAQETATPIELRIERAAPPRPRRGSPASRPARRSAAGHPRQPRDGRGLSRARRRIHPGHRCRRPPMLRLPVLLRPQARQGPRAAARRDDHAQPDRARLSGAGAAGKMLRPGHGAAGRDHPGHRRPPRRVRARLLRKILRGHGLSRSRQLHRQFQRRARPLRRRSAQGLDGAELLLQHRHRRQ